MCCVVKSLGSAVLSVPWACRRMHPVLSQGMQDIISRHLCFPVRSWPQNYLWRRRCWRATEGDFASYFLLFAFNALTLLVRWQEGRLACKNWWDVGVVIRLGEVQICIWLIWCDCHSLSPASVKSSLVLPFWYQLTWVVLEKGPLNGCVCVCMHVCFLLFVRYRNSVDNTVEENCNVLCWLPSVKHCTNNIF